MNSSRKNIFYIYLVDKDKKIFNLLDPTNDDTAWTKKIAEISSSGKNVMCFTDPADKSKYEKIKEYSDQTGYTYTKTLITDKPESHNTEYRCNIPIYAKNADRKKLVRILCKGGCQNRNSLAQMNVDYPSREVLRNSKVGDYTAKCLRCGSIAKDCHKWTRK